MENDQTDNSGQFYTFDEVMNILGRKKATLYREIEEGKIPFWLPAGKKIGMRFPKEGINIIAKRERRERVLKRVEPLRFVSSTTSDLWTAVDNARRLYGDDDIISFERALEWRDINPDISMSVKLDGQCVGMVTFLPIDEQVIMALLRDEMRERDIPDQSIRRWTDPALSVYVAGIAIIETNDLLTNRQRGRFLLEHTIRWGITLSTQYAIKNWYGIGVTPDGQTILEQLGFRELIVLEDGKRKGYVLEHMHTHPTRLIRRFLSSMDPTSESQ